MGSKEGFPVSLATAFNTGRRIGTTQAPDSSGVYFVLRTSEVPLALQEVDALLALDRPGARSALAVATSSPPQRAADRCRP